jgi:hypothetical protein
MATAKETKTADMNVYQKLLEARCKFLTSNVQKTGKNMNLSFKYFELEDIVPIATPIFKEVGLLPLVTFPTGIAKMDIINTDKPEEVLSIEIEFEPLAPIVSNAGKEVTNKMQALGSSITYMRRYLYMVALDVCEPDEVDLKAGTAPAVVTATPAIKPVVVAPKAEPAPAPLTDANGNASELQIAQLKKVLGELLTADPTKEEMIAKIAVETQAFTVISKADCEALTIKANELLKEVK